MRPELRKLLYDMRSAAKDVAGFAAGRSFDDFLADKQLRMAIERGFEIVGEGLTQINKIDPNTAQRISDWRAIIGFRNVLIHGYAQVDNAKTWDIVQTELPVLSRELEILLAEGDK
jgi:uncharacterized protein with HEPN domain